MRILFLALLVLPPVASAGEFHLDDDLDPRYREIPLIVPCLVLDVTIERPEGEPARVDHPPKGAPFDWCSMPRVEVRWNATLSRGHGAVSFVFDSSQLNSTADLEGERPPPSTSVSGLEHAIKSADEPEMVPLSVVSNLLRSLSASTPAQSETIPRRTVIVSAAFDVAWADGCAHASGSFSATIDGSPMDAAAPSGLFETLCGLSTSDPGEVAPRLADAALSVGRALAPAVAPPGFGGVLDGLAVLAALLAPDAPAPPEHEDRAAGNATIEALAPDGLVSASGNASVTTTLVPSEPEPLAIHEPAPAPEAAHPSSLAPPLPRAPAVAAAPARGEPQPRPADAAPPAAPIQHEDPSGASTRAMLASAQPAQRSVPPALVAALVAPLVVAIAVALYQRVTKPAALQQTRRAALHAACRSLGRPATAGELAALAGLPRKSAEYHLSYLVKLGLLRADESGGVRRFAIHGAPRPEAPVDVEAALLARIGSAPGESVAEVAKALGLGRLRVDRRVKDLLLEGRLESRVEAGRRQLYLPPAARRSDAHRIAKRTSESTPAPLSES